MIPQVQDQADFRVMKMFILTYQFHFSIDILSTVLLAIEHVIDLINVDILLVTQFQRFVRNSQVCFCWGGEGG